METKWQILQKDRTFSRCSAFRKSNVATSNPQKEYCTVFSFLSPGWSLICRKSKTNPQKPFEVCRNNHGTRKEGNLTVYLNCHLVWISTPVAGTFILRILSHLLFHTKPWKPSQTCWNNSGWKVAKKKRWKIFNNFNAWPVLLTWRRAGTPRGSNVFCSQKKGWLTEDPAREEMFL